LRELFKPMKFPIYISLLISLSWSLTVMAQTEGVDSSRMNIQGGGVNNKSSQSYAAVQASDTIIVPNVFTPNDDLINDEFEVSSSGSYFLSLKIFTRTGIMIYKTLAKTIKWDGRLDSGEKVLPGIYYYILETVDVAPPVRKTGFVYIFK
jgi:gliding motility-associated-like protein